MLLKYRPEVDGLRAIAVISVVLYHADFVYWNRNLFQGGFIGVDIFFVISGFLITLIILRELQTNKSFSFLNFYDRRARRILPALFTMMLVSLPFAWYFMLPKALKEFSGSTLSSLFFGSNFWFWQENTYTAEASQLKPFLHTWTLSVEEQFYIFFPIALLLLWKFAHKYLLLGLVIGFLLSLQLAHIGSKNFPNSTFYLLPTRGWELLAGSMLAQLRYSYDQNSPTVLSKIMPSLGLILIMISIFTFKDTMQHPSYITLLPVIGTMLLIWFMKKGELVTDLLSTKPMVGIGLISYSLYLWHFPVFALARIKLGDITTSDKFVLILLSITLAAFAFFFIEQPARNKQAISRRVMLILMFGVFSFLTVINALIFYHDLKPKRFVSLEKMIAFKYDYSVPYREGECFIQPKQLEAAVNKKESRLFKDCKINQYSANKPTLVLWGDSHAAHLFPGYDRVYAKTYNIVQRTSSLCAPIINRDVKSRPGCREVNNEVFEEILELQPDRLVLAGAWAKGYAEILKPTIFALQKQGVTNIEIIGPVPNWKGGLPKQLVIFMQNNGTMPEYMGQGLNKHTFDVDSEMSIFASEMNITYYSPLSVLCKNKRCLTRLGTKADDIVQLDSAHLTKSGSIYVVQQLEKQAKNH